MQFIKTNDSKPLEDAMVNDLTAALSHGEKVLWLVPGGSNIVIAVQVMARLPVELTNHLTIFLTDERYGPLGHADSNYQQLVDAGLRLGNATFVPILTGESFAQTTADANQTAKRLFTESSTIIGFFGMGADGHTAGILPGSPAATSTEWVAGYKTPQYTRITLTPFALAHVTSAYLGAYGAEKLPALKQLQDKTLPTAQQPVQLLKQLPGAMIYNDQIGENQ